MIVIGAMVKDEHLDLREWVVWNQKLGFDHIQLYDNNSSREYHDELAGLTGYVSVKPWPTDDRFRQRAMYNDMTFNRQWGASDWCAFIDPDEFIVLDEAATIKEFVAGYADHPGVALSWRCYGADGHVERPNAPLREAYVTPAPKVRENHNFKSIVKPKAVSYWADVHRAVLHGKPLVNTKRQSIYNSFVRDEYHAARVDHYITKSWEDYLRRLERGNVTPGIRKIETFFAYNPDLRDRFAELTAGLDVTRFKTTQTDRDVQKMVEEVWASDVFFRLRQAAGEEVPDSLFKQVCVVELINLAAMKLERLTGKGPIAQAKARDQMNAMVDKQIEFLRSLPADLPNYRKQVVEAIISTPF